ncbi:nitrate ABC transporter substrate-binding protein [soil metagenome]
MHTSRRAWAVTIASLIGIAGIGAFPGAGAATVPPETDDAGTVVELADVCPDPIVIQTDWFPESEYGATYGLLGDDYTVDADNKIVTGSLMSQGHDTGVDVEIRSGGVAGTDVETAMYTDDSVNFAYGTTDGQILKWDAAPLMSVVAPLEINPQIIMWDPETYPDVATLADLGTENITINVFGGSTFADIFVADGTWSADQVDPSYDGGPSRFIAEDGKIAQQGFVSSEPYAYENLFEEWGRPVVYQTIHDAGFQVYSETFAIRPDDLEAYRPCLEVFVPVVQQSAVDFVTDPTRTNAVIVDIVAQYDTFWEYPAEIAEYSVATQAELGLTGNGDDDTLGNFDEARIDTVLQQMRDAGLDIDPDLQADDLFTNEFIDPAIGLAS